MLPRFPNINKNIIALGFVSFFTDMASSMVTPLIPILIIHILHQDIQVLSQVVAIATFISYGFRILFGYLGDRFQLTKPFIVIGYSLSALIKPFYYLVGSWQGVATLQSSERLGKAFRSASKDSLIAAYTDKNESGKTFGFHKMMDIAGELFGATLVFVVLFYLGESESIIRMIFAATILPGLIAVVIVVFFVEDAPYVSKKNHQHWHPNDTKLLPVLGLYFALLFFICSNSFYVIKATDLGYSIAYIPLFYIALNLIQTLTSYYFGLKIDRIGSIRMLLLAFGFGIMTLLFFLLSYIWLAFIFLGLFSVSSLNAIRSYISHHAENKSTVFGIFYGGTAVSGALGALLTGYLWSDYGVTFATLTSITGATIVFLLLLTRSNAQLK
jgi:MFS family permease